jgi:hypothetical protein
MIMTFIAYIKQPDLSIVYVGPDSYHAWLKLEKAWEESSAGFGYLETWRGGCKVETIEYYGQEFNYGG